MPYKDPEIAKIKREERWLRWEQKNPGEAAARSKRWRKKKRRSRKS